MILSLLTGIVCDLCRKWKVRQCVEIPGYVMNSAFVFATWIVQSFCFLNTNFQAVVVQPG